MSTKKDNRNIDRRKLRRREKGSEVTRDKTIGKCCRRGYGKGIASH